MTPNEWIIKGRVGISSQTIWAVLNGVVTDGPRQCGRTNDNEWYDTPSDPSDFGRCFDLLEAIHGWRERLGEVAAVFPKWGPLVREWARLETLYREERPKGRAPKLWDAMKALEDEAMALDGWTKDGPSAWTR